MKVIHGEKYRFNKTNTILNKSSIHFNNRSKNSLTSIGDGMNCTFEHVVTVQGLAGLEKTDGVD